MSLNCPKMVTHVDAQLPGLISALSRHAAKTSVHAEGIEACKKLAITDTQKAVQNADSYGFFVVDAESQKVTSLAFR